MKSFWDNKNYGKSQREVLLVVDVRDMVNHSNYILPFFMPVIYYLTN